MLLKVFQMHILQLLVCNNLCVSFSIFFTGDGPTAHLYAAMHGAENRLYCKPRFLTHDELAEVK